MWTFLKPLLPRSGKGWGGLGGDLGRTGEEGATCVNCRLLPLRTVSSHSLLQTDKRGRCDLTPIVNWQLIMQLTHSHRRIHQGQGQNKDKERGRDKDKDGLYILRHSLSKEREGTSGKLGNFRKQKRRKITTQLTN